MTCLVQQIGSSHANEKHLQDGIFHNHACKYGGKGYEVVLQLQALGLACPDADKDVGEHRDDITEVVADVA